MSNNIEAIIFDVDGTLLDTEILSEKAILKVLKQFEKDNLWNWELNKKTLGLRSSDWVPLVLKELDLTNDISENDFFNAWERNLHDLVQEVEFMPGALDLISFFVNKGIPLAVATSSTSQSFQNKMSRHKSIFQKFKLFVCGDDPYLKSGKPAPDIYLLAAERLSIKPENCLVFEDALSGVLSAKAAGMFCCACPDPRLDKKMFIDNCHSVLDSLEEFNYSDWNLIQKRC